MAKEGEPIEPIDVSCCYYYYCCYSFCCYLLFLLICFLSTRFMAQREQGLGTTTITTTTTLITTTTTTRDFVRSVVQLSYSRIVAPHRVHELKSV